MRKLIFALFIVAAIVAAPCGSVFAGKIDGVSLNAQGTVNTFNNMNGGQGFLFTTIPDNPDDTQNLWTLHNRGIDAPSTSAYYNNTIQTFTMYDYHQDGAINWKGTLNYTNGMTLTHQTVYNDDLDKDIPVTMSVGTAYLYKMFATGKIDFSTGNYSQEAFHDKMYEFSFSDNGDLENMLLSINPDKDYWLSTYDPDAYYNEIGNYSVFYMTAYKDFGKKRDLDYIYIVEAADPYAAQTPEPTTMMLLGTGLLALPFARRFLTNRQTK